MFTDKREPFHKSVIGFIMYASAPEMVLLAKMIHETQIPPSSHSEIRRAWERRCSEIKCPNHDVSKRLSS